MKFVRLLLVCAAGLAAYFVRRGVLAAALAATAAYVALTPLFLVYIVPRRLVSYLVGKLMKVPLGPLRVSVLKLYMRLAKVDPATVERPLNSFRSVQDFFSRQLDLTKRGFSLTNNQWALPNANQSSVYAPADSVLSQHGFVDSASIRVKGANFSLAQMVNDPQVDSKNVFFAVFYLSPADYHSFHAPFELQASRIEHVHGELWPVNGTFMPRVEGLLAKNERVVVSGSWHGQKAWFVPVGALNVSTVKMNQIQLLKRKALSFQQFYRAGQQMGQFEFGSTVVVLFEVPAGKTVKVLQQGKVRTGDEVIALE